MFHFINSHFKSRTNIVIKKIFYRLNAFFNGKMRFFYLFVRYNTSKMRQIEFFRCAFHHLSGIS